MSQDDKKTSSTAATSTRTGTPGSATSPSTRASAVAGSTPPKGGQKDSEKTAADMAKDTKDAVKTKAEEARHSARQTADDAMKRGKQEVHDRSSAASTAASDQVEETADALRDAGEHFDENDLRHRTAGQLADGLSSVASGLRGKDLGDIANDLTRFARRNPVAFFAGAALIGFAASRLLKASERNSHYGYDDDYDDGDYAYEPDRYGTSPSSRASTAGSSAAARRGAAPAPTPGVSPTSPDHTPGSGGSV